MKAKAKAWTLTGFFGAVVILATACPLDRRSRPADSDLVIFSVLGDRLISVRGRDCWSTDHRAGITRADGVRYQVAVGSGLVVCARRP